MSKKPKLFISHSTQDKTYVSYLVKLFKAMGVDEDSIFCSSTLGSGVPLDRNIYDYLKEQFQNYDLKVIFALSNNYYKSAASLNEMGAAWVLSQSYTSILLPQFEFKDIKGAIDPRAISIKLDSAERELKDKLGQLYDEIKIIFGLRPRKSWEEDRDEFIEKVRRIINLWEEIKYLEKNNRPASELIVPLGQLVAIDPYDFDSLALLGVKYMVSKDQMNAIRYLEQAEKVAWNEEQLNNVRSMKYKVKFN